MTRLLFTRLVMLLALAAHLGLGATIHAAADSANTISGTVSEFQLRPKFAAHPMQIAAGNDHWSRILPADFNGDNCSDLLLVDDNGGLSISSGHCNGSFSPPRRLSSPRQAAGSRIVAGNLDSDHCADIAVLHEIEIETVAGDCRGGFSLPTKITAFERILDGPIDFGIFTESGRRELVIGNPAIPHIQHFDLPFAETGRYGQQAQILPVARFLAIGNLDDDPLSELISSTPKSPYLWAQDARTFYLPGDRPDWYATFPLHSGWSDAQVGDFNGDGYSDILMRGDGLAGWWIAQSNGRTGLEMPVVLPLGPASLTYFIEPFDFDGDARTDLLSCAAGPPLSCRAFSMLSQPIAGVTVRSGSAESRTDASGRFAINRADAGSDIEAQSPQWIFPRKLPLEPSRSRYHFLGVNRSEFLSERGRNDHYVPVPPGPKVCIGYLAYAPVDHGGFSKWGSNFFPRCADDAAWFAVDDSYNGDRGAYQGYCCRLPADDILVGEPIYVRNGAICPDGAVATGRTVLKTAGSDLICRRVNSERYRLGPAEPGIYFGQGASGRFSGARVSREELPPAFRFAIRNSYDSMPTDGCVPKAAGSLYVGSTGGYKCDAHLFRPLERKKVSANGERWEAVEIFPDCKRAPDWRNPIAGCR